MKRLIHPFFLATVAMCYGAAHLLAYCARHQIGKTDPSLVNLPFNLIIAIAWLVALVVIESGVEHIRMRLLWFARSKGK